MTKQEEIREGIKEILNENYVLLPKGWTKEDQMLRDILIYLHSQGVVIKVDRKLPPQVWHRIPSANEINLIHERDIQIMGAGYVAVESLIKEVNNELET